MPVGGRALAPGAVDRRRCATFPGRSRSRAAPFFSEQPVYGAGEPQVALRQPAGVMRGKQDLHAVEDIGPLRVVVLRFRQQRDPGHEPPGFAEVAEAEAAADRVPPFGQASMPGNAAAKPARAASSRRSTMPRLLVA